MNVRPALAPSMLCALLALAACDAGDRAKKENASPGPKLFITSPKMDQTIATDDAHLKADDDSAKKPEGKDVEVMLDLRDYEVGKVEDEKSGQHVHVIVDDGAYQACYDVSKGFPVGRLAPGTHVIRAFPSAGPKDPKGAAHHESRKNPGSFAWVRFHVKEKGGPLADFDGTKPLLTYSRPKGEYLPGKPETTKLLLDFYVTNVALSKDGFKVRASLDGAVHGTYDTWKAEYGWLNPYFVEPTPAAGEHKLLLELIDASGALVQGPFNRTERTITIK